MGSLTAVAMSQTRGETPRALVWEKIKGSCPASLEWASLNGKVVLISFRGDDVFPEDVADWAEVSQKFRDKPVAFIQIVGGSEFLLDQALKATEFPGCILFDSAHANAQNFKLPSFSGTVAVDKRGVITDYSRGDPDEGRILAVLGDEQPSDLSEAPPRLQPNDPAAGEDSLPFFEVQILPAPKNELRALGQGGQNSYISKNEPLKVIILDLWDMPLARISFSENFDERNYDVVARIPFDDRQLLRTLVREGIERQFGLRIERVTRMQKAYTLTSALTPASGIEPGGEDDVPMSGVGQGSLIGTAQSLQDIANALEGLLGAPVINETGLTGKYNYSVSSKMPQPEAVFDFADKLGLKLAPVERPIEILVIQKLASGERR